MPWFKVDDNLAFHQKVLRAGNTAMGMWVRAGSWCSHQLEDGFVTDEVVATMGGHSLAKRLVDAQLWLRVDGGYEFHQWLERQPKRVDVERERKAAQLRKEKWRERRQNGDGTPSGTAVERRSGHDGNAVRNGDGTPSGTATPVARVNPTRPDPVKNQERRTRTRNIRSAEPSTRDPFDEFWIAYPRHVAKRAARQRWDSLVKSGADPDAIIAGAGAYAEQVRSVEPRFVKQPDGWLNAGRWEDEPAPAPSRPSTPWAGA